jgi:hypothetical protein
VLRGNPELMLREVDEFSKARLFILIEQSNFSALEQEFKEDSRGLKIRSFIWLLERSIDYDEARKFELALGLYKLFQAINEGMSTRVSWPSFLRFGASISASQLAPERPLGAGPL